MFRLFGFDVFVRTGFIVFLALLVFLYQDRLGLWLAGSIAVFTLLHEFGHAVAARSAGATAQISLDFMAGYTSFRPDPKRPLTAARRALISFSGPGVHIAASVAVLIAMGINPLSLDSVRSSDAARAIWWAGPAIGTMNLIPVLPLDGGHIALTALERITGKQALRQMAIASIAITLGGAVMLFSSGYGGIAIFVVFLLLSQFQILQSSGRQGGRGPAPNRAMNAETAAWQTGRPGILEPGQRLSPWFEAHRLLMAGDRDGAVRTIVADLASPTPGRWVPPQGASAAQLRAVVDALPSELPIGNLQSARVAVDIMLAVGDHRRAGTYAAAVFQHHRASPLALAVARAAAAGGDDANAIAWLAAAESAALDEPEGYLTLLARAVDQAPELQRLRRLADFAALRSRLPA